MESCNRDLEIGLFSQRDVPEIHPGGGVCPFPCKARIISAYGCTLIIFNQSPGDGHLVVSTSPIENGCSATFACTPLGVVGPKPPGCCSL